MSNSERGKLSSLSEGGRRDILAAGLNAHEQLSKSDQDDLFKFHPIFSGAGHELQILFAGWSVTAIIHDNHLVVLGHQDFLQALQSRGVRLKSGFGDHDGIAGCLDHQGQLYLTEQKGDRSLSIVNQHRDNSLALDHVAQAGNDRIAVALSPKPQSRVCDILEFASAAAFRQWFQDPTESSCIDKHHQIRGRAKQLLASIATFVLLTESGEVYTWGDPRHRSLARSIVGQDASPADTPGYVEALGGLRIAKVASGGWMSAALSEDGAAYFWGAPMPGKEGSMQFLHEAGAGNTALIDLAGDGPEPLDILDIAVGENHAALLAEGNRVFVVGENQNGQLGLDTGSPTFSEDWREVPFPGRAEALHCGPKSTFLITLPDPDLTPSPLQSKPTPLITESLP